MMQIIEQTDKQKMKMYMKLSKKKLAKMLIQCNKILDTMPVITYTVDTQWDLTYNLKQKPIVTASN